jgi:hypothetical protein
MEATNSFVIPGRDEVASPESILSIVVMDSLMCNCTSKLALRAPRNDER